MSFNQEELGIIEYAKANGKTRQETEQALMKYRETKTPAEQEQKPGFLGQVKSDVINRTSNIGENIKEVATQKMSPLQTSERSLRVLGEGAGLVGDVIGAGFNKGLEAVGFSEPLGRTIEAVFGGAADKYGEWKFKHPEAAQDFEAVANIASLLPIGKAGQVAGKAGQVAGKATIKGGKTLLGGVEQAGKATKIGGDALYKTAYDYTALEAPRVQKYRADVPFLDRVKNALNDITPKNKPVTTGDTALRMGLKGSAATIGVGARQAADTLWTQAIGPTLQSIKGRVRIKEDWIAGVKNNIIKNTKELTRKKGLLEALDAFADDYKKVSKVSYFQLQKYKEGLAKFVPQKYYKGKDIASDFGEVKALLAEQARKLIYDAKIDKQHLPYGYDFKTAYLDYGNLKNLMELGEGALTQSKLKGASFMGLNALYNIATVPVKTVGGQVLYRVGQKLEILGQAGAKKLGDLIK